MTRLHATLARIVLATAAAASVATSKVPRDWQLTAGAPRVTAVVEDATPRLVTGFHAELGGWGPAGVDGGLLSVRVTLRARTTGPGTATGRLVLEARTYPGETLGYALVRGETRTFDLDLPVFDRCLADPCSADATLTIERDFQLDDPALDITIESTVDANGAGDQPLDASLQLGTAPVPQ
jgi:hypothetical protein